MVILRVSSWLRAILLLSCLGLIFASNLPPCSDMQDGQAIGINLSLDAVTALCIPSLDQAVTLAAEDSRSIESPLRKYATSMRTLRAKYYRERHAKPRRFSALWGKLYHLRAALFGFKTPTPPNIEETGEPSTNQTRLGFLEAFQRVKEVALEDHGTNITSAVILFPRFFSREVQNLVVEAAREVGIMPLFQESPDWLLSRFENILEPNPTIEKAARPQKLLIIDYGIWHFDVRTYGSRCKLNYPIDSMGSAKIIFKLANRLKSTNMDIQQQLAQGASFDTLVKAVHQSRWLMKMDIGVDLSDEEASKKEVPEKWPLDLDDWWIGQKKESFIYWDDMRSVEAEYVSELAETLDDLHNCLKELKPREGQESNQTYSTFDKVIILGNSHDRPIISQAVRENIGDHVRFIGGTRGTDILLEALAGARFAFFHLEATAKWKKTEEEIQKIMDLQQLSDHEEL